MLRFIINSIFNFGIIQSFALIFVLINIFTFLLYAADKYKATKNGWRVSEKLLIFFTLSLGGIGALVGMYLMKHKTGKLKFKLAATIGLIIVFIPAIHIAYSFTSGRIIRFAEIEFVSENLPPWLEGYRIAFMTDMHIIAHEDMRKIIEELNNRNLDLLLLGGDFSMGNDHYQGTLREISKTVTTDGIFGVEGNHDDYTRLFRAKKQYGIIPLDNSGIHIREGFYLAGVQDMWNRNPDINEAVAKSQSDDFVLLISHNPDVSMVQPTTGIDLILAGHTHNGQIAPFGFPVYLLRNHITSYGTRFAHGFAYSAEGVPVFVSSGVGVYYGIPRIFTRPEVVIFTVISSGSCDFYY